MNIVFPEGVAHADHGITDEQRDYIQAHPDLLALEEGAFIKTVIALPPELGTAPCALYGPAVGDAPAGDDYVIVYLRRGNRKGPSRMINAWVQPATSVVVIGIRGSICFTMYGTRASEPSPREPWDARTVEEYAASMAFWGKHALCLVDPHEQDTLAHQFGEALSVEEES